MAELVFYTGTMDSGKTTLALQTHFNYSHAGRKGLVFGSYDRAGVGKISSRIGLQTDAIETNPDLDFWEVVTRERGERGQNIDYIVCDEAQFYTPAQVAQLARLADELNIDVYAFGIQTDFRTKLFPGSQRLLELADRIEMLQVPALCWCGRRATHNARTINGKMVLSGDQVIVGDTHTPAEISYQVLCRRHHLSQELA